MSTRGQVDFVAEANEIIDRLGRELLALDERREEELDPQRLHAIFRWAHSLKGLASMFGQPELASLAHHAEDLLDRLRLGKARPTNEVMDALVESVDVFGLLLAEAAAGEGATGAAIPLARQLGERLGALVAEPSLNVEQSEALDLLGLPAAVRSVLTEYEEHRLNESLRKGRQLWKVRAVYALADFEQGLGVLLDALKPVGEVICTLPSSEPGTSDRVAFDLVIAAPGDREAVDKAVAPLGAHVSSFGAARSAAFRRDEVLRRVPGPGPRSDTDGSLRSLSQTVRVDIGRLDGLMNTVAELLRTKTHLQRLAETARQGGAQAVAKSWGQELAREARVLERKLEQLQGGILGARMVPLALVFDKLARLVRRIAREKGKPIELSIRGGDVELDKLIVEELSDPLMHIIRNAIDHGIEPPKERARLGKAAHGAIALSARPQGNQVIVEVSDDGRGLDEERIRKVAVERALLTSDDASALGPRALQNLIFLPGLSTADQVSQLSGRGVGLDVARTNIARLSGMIDVTSEKGRGTSFAITLPVTLAIIRALIVEVSGRTYALPLNSVVEILSVEPAELRTVERQEVVAVRGQQLPSIRLARLFGFSERTSARHFVVVLGLAQERLGLGVDGLSGQQDIVVKPLGGRLRQLPGIAGATDLGNRRTVLVLDAGALISQARQVQRRPEPQPNARTR